MQRSYQFLLLTAFTVCQVSLPASAQSESSSHNSVWTFEQNLDDSGVNGCRVCVKKPLFVEGADGGLALNPLNSAYVQDSPWIRATPGFRIDCHVRFNKLWEGGAWTTVAMKGIS